MKKFIFIIFLPILNLRRTLFLYKNVQSEFFERIVRKRLSERFTISITEGAKVEKSIEFPHPYSIVIGYGVEIGENCVVYQDVTIGVSSREVFFQDSSLDDIRNAYPKIGNNVTIYPGAKVFGGITIGDNSVIGANAVVNKDVKPFDTVIGVPARSISLKK